MVYKTTARLTFSICLLAFNTDHTAVDNAYIMYKCNKMLQKTGSVDQL